ncbi:hypothetical protein EDD36DRAFT_306770 [Exophiala viscosa]|uniref:Uncharacterized protein n=1 Tax=Exophiala viscosa TaxID=2486360 RepID=A0AAN6IAQ5_9EURO|nr:hypothetical protein EDD36DRAFT_306770 [Exophiala viscosa]
MALNTVNKVESPAPTTTYSSTAVRPAKDSPTTSVTGSNTTTLVASVNPTSKTISLSSKTFAIAGVAAAIAVILTIILGLTIYCCLRRRTSRKLRGRADPFPVMRRGYRALHDDTAVDETSLPHRPQRTLLSSTRYSPSTAVDSSTYTMGEKRQGPEPQEMMGVGLTPEEFDRRSNSRSPALSVEGPVELASQRFSAVIPKDVDEEQPRPETRPGRRRERQSQLRSSPAIRDLRVEASRSPSANPAGRLLPSG